MLYFLLAFFSLLVNVVSQTVAVANPSSSRQVRWVIVPTSYAQTRNYSQVCIVGPGVIAVKGRSLGDHTQLWYARVDIAGGESGSTDQWQQLPNAQIPPIRLSSWITDDLNKLVPRVRVTTSEGTLIVPMQDFRAVENNPVVITWFSSGSMGGWHWRLWAKTWTEQDAVDIRGYVVWSDPLNPNWFLDNVEISFELGEPVHLYFAGRSGFTQNGPGNWTIWRGRAPHGFAFPFRGIVAPRSDVTEDPNGFDEYRNDILQAATQAPLVATCKWPKGDWLAFGTVPNKVYNTTKEKAISYLHGTGSLVDARPLANNLVTGDTGGQACFGAQKDFVAISGDPWRVLELLWSADDYLLRSRHHRELSGTTVTKEIRPNLQTWSGQPERNSPDTLGKSRTQPWGWDKVGNRSVLVDDQHRGDAYIITTAALTGDEALLDDLADSIFVDEMRAKTARNQLDAPRASGRLWQSWAKMYRIMPPWLQSRLKRLAEKELAMREVQYPVGAPVQPTWIIQDDRVIYGKIPAWVPWNESLSVLGSYEQEQLWGSRDPALSARFGLFSEKLSRTIVGYGTVPLDTGNYLPATGVIYLPGGVANSADYYTYPRVGAGTSPGPGINLLMGTAGWFEWFSGALAVTYNGQGETAERSRKIWRDMGFDNPGSLQSAEWTALEKR